VTLKSGFFLLKKGKKGGVPFRPEPFFINFRCKKQKNRSPHPCHSVATPEACSGFSLFQTKNIKKRLWPKWLTPVFALFRQKVTGFQCPPFQKAKRQLKFGLFSLQTTPPSNNSAVRESGLQFFVARWHNPNPQKN
jgi:hypothetical protein